MSVQQSMRSCLIKSLYPSYKAQNLPVFELAEDCDIAVMLPSAAKYQIYPLDSEQTTPRLLSSLQADFDKSAEVAKTLPDSVTNDEKLQLYGLFKQGTVGDVTTCQSPPPSPPPAPLPSPLSDPATFLLRVTRPTKSYRFHRYLASYLTCRLPPTQALAALHFEKCCVNVKATCRIEVG